MCKCRQLPIYHVARIGNWNLKLATFADLDRRSLGDGGWQHYPMPEPLRHPKITLSAKTALYRNLISTLLGVPPLKFLQLFNCSNTYLPQNFPLHLPNFIGISSRYKAA